MKKLFYLSFILAIFLVSGVIYGLEVFAQKVEPSQAPLIVDLKVNGSDGPVKVLPNDKLQVSWTSQGFTRPDPTAPCVFSNYPTGSPLGNISSLSGSATISYGSVTPPRTVDLTLTCFNGLRTTDAVSSAPSASDNVTVVVTEPVAGLVPRYSQNLYFGIKNSSVSNLQNDLSTDSSIYPEKLVTGYFGSLTLKAVKRFQAKYGIFQTGYVGPLTRAKLNKLYTSNNQLTCILINGTVGNILINSPATFSASGGNGVYGWSAPGGRPSSGTGNQFSTVPPTTGIFTVTVTSEALSATCAASVVAP